MIVVPGRIPIRIFPLFWVLIVFIGWMNSASIEGTFIWSIVILISVLVHEYGHALTAIAFGQEAEIDLIGLGGLTRRTGKSLRKWQEFLIVLNGPFAGLVLFFFVYHMQPFIASHGMAALDYALKAAIAVNLFWTILNLLPILPLDGGHLLRILLESFFGFNGLKVALLLSMVLAGICSVVFFLMGSFFAGALFLMMTFEGYRTWSGIKEASLQDTSSHLQELFREAMSDLQADRRSEALSKFFLLREQSEKGILFIESTQHIARLLAQQGHIQQAYEWLLPIRNQLSIDYLKFLQQLAYRLQEWEEAIKAGQLAYQREPASEIALLNAFAYAIVGKAKPAVGWLYSARQSGLPNLNEIIDKREFDAIRKTDEFQALVRRLSS